MDELRDGAYTAQWRHLYSTDCRATRAVRGLVKAEWSRAPSFTRTGDWSKWTGPSGLVEASALLASQMMAAAACVSPPRSRRPGLRGRNGFSAPMSPLPPSLPPYSLSLFLSRSRSLARSLLRLSLPPTHPPSLSPCACRLSEEGLLVPGPTSGQARFKKMARTGLRGQSLPPQQRSGAPRVGGPCLVPACLSGQDNRSSPTDAARKERGRKGAVPQGPLSSPPVPLVLA